MLLLTVPTQLANVKAEIEALLEIQSNATWTVTDLTALKEEVLKVEKLFHHAKEKSVEFAADFAVHRQGHEAKEKQLNTNIAKLRSSLRANESKQKASQQRTQADIQAQKTMGKELEGLRSEHQSWKERKDLANKAMNALSIYQRYLEKVNDLMPDTTRPQDLLIRWETLQAVNNDTFTTLQQRTIDTNTLSQSLASKLNETRVNRIATNNQLMELRKKLQAVQSRRKALESQHSQNMANATQAQLLSGQVRMTAANLFAAVRPQPSDAADLDTAGHLDKTNNYIHYLERILTCAKSL